MSKSEVVKFEESIRDRIFSIRGYQVMLDRDLAELYGVEVRYLNRAVKRNIERFPSEFCFLLNNQEMTNLKFQFGTSSWGGRRKTEVVANCDHLKKLKLSYVLPYVFTEQGVV